MISNKIEQLRKEKNVKQTDIAQAIGFTVSGYQKAIQANDFKVSTLEKIAEALEVPITYFFEDSGDKHFLSEIFLLSKDVKPSFLLVLTGGQYAYRRKDGVYVVPIGCFKD